MDRLKNSRNLVPLIMGAAIIALGVIIILQARKIKKQKEGNGDTNDPLQDNSCQDGLNCIGKCLEYDLSRGTCQCMSGQCQFVPYPIDQQPYVETPSTDPINGGYCSSTDDCSSFCLEYDLDKGACTCTDGSCVFLPYPVENIPYSVASQQAQPGSHEHRNKALLVDDNFLSDNVRPASMYDEEGMEKSVFLTSPNGLRTPLANLYQ